MPFMTTQYRHMAKMAYWLQLQHVSVGKSSGHSVSLNSTNNVSLIHIFEEQLARSGAYKVQYKSPFTLSAMRAE